VRVGILGGTFDPVHNGHLALARAAQAGLGLELVLFIPAGEPWRKTREITPAEHRLEMLRLAIAGEPAFGISDVELRRSGPTYTADTLEALAGERLDDSFWFIVGADALIDLPQWMNPERIVNHAVIAVADRDGTSVETAIGAATAAVPALAGRIERFAMPVVDVSSTEVRARVAAGEDIAENVPAAVATYIRDHSLYAERS
jgi:nicotinate-nucleotide adenylyltransferase